MPEPAFVFAHGAGAASSHPWMQAWKKRLEMLGPVFPFDYAYISEGRKRPDRLPELVAAHREAIARARLSHAGPLVLIGKSMGGRVGCHVALETDVAALVCMGYPLCGGGNPTKLRDKVLLALSTPILFVQGTRDQLCPPEMLERVRGAMKATNTLHVVEDGDHSLIVTKGRLKANGETQEEVDQRILRAIEQFIRSPHQATGGGRVYFHEYLPGRILYRSRTPGPQLPVPIPDWR